MELNRCQTKRVTAVAVSVAIVVTALARPDQMDTEKTELRDLDVTGWECTSDGNAQTQEVKERNQAKNRSRLNLSAFRIETLDTAAFLKKVREYDSRLKSHYRSELTAAQKSQLNSFENQIVSLTGWLVLAYATAAEAANCGSTDFHDWHLEIFETQLDHAPEVGDSTPIICEITPRTEQAIYRDGVRVQALSGFLRLVDVTYRSTGHTAKKVRVTGFLMWDDDHNRSADVGSTIQYFSEDGFHHPWRSTAWEIHPVMKVEVLE
jgi:hypothetical protein